MLAHNYHIALEYIEEFLVVHSYTELLDLLSECHPDLSSLAEKQLLLNALQKSESLCKDTISLLYLNSITAQLYS